MENNKLESLRSRVKYFLDSENINMSEYARECGVSTSFVLSIKKNIGADKIAILKKINKNLSLEWLLFGKGSMLQTPSAEIQTLRSELETALKQNSELKTENAQLKRENALLQRIADLTDETKKAR